MKRLGSTLITLIRIGATPRTQVLEKVCVDAEAAVNLVFGFDAFGHFGTLVFSGVINVPG
mgnify:CR=1 FL=1